MGYIVYEDRPHTDVWIKLTFLIPTVIILVIALIFSGFDPQSSSYSICEAAGIAILMALLYFFVIPVKYCILNDKVRIGFRGPFSFNIPFEHIRSIYKARWWTIGINFPANFSQSNMLEIRRKGRLAVTITPADKTAFIDNFKLAYENWRRGKND
ncbi:MAG: PH domain-containing protein [Dehalococcoidia bacterium]|nr:PH domain-containing protein [Dehalococcoidia bacterium]